MFFWSYYLLFANLQHLTKERRGKLDGYKVDPDSLYGSVDLIVKRKEDRGGSCCNCTCTTSAQMDLAHS